MLKTRTFLVVTGANRGIGRQIAIDFSAELGDSSTVLLLGRRAADLEPVADEIRSVAGVQHVLCFGVDLQQYDPEAHRAFLCHSVPDPAAYEQCLLVNNAGTAEAKRLCLEYESMADINAFLTVNVASAISLTSVILKYFALVSRKVVVNITSKAAVSPLKSCSLYCAAKAARNMFFRVLAEEYPDVRVLNYAPGPVDTAMFHHVRTNSVAHDVKEHFETITPLSTQMTTSRLMNILREDKYKSGDYIDFFDLA